MRARRSAFAALFAAIVGASTLTTALLGAPATAAAQATLPGLSPWDAQLYSAAFDAARRGDHAAARASAARASDPILAGWLGAQRLLAVDAAPYDDLRAWLEAHRDHPNAQRIYALALRARPAGAPAPMQPIVAANARGWNGVGAAPRRIGAPPVTPSQQRARDLFYEGRIAEAYAAAVASNERWIAGLAAFRQRDFAEAVQRFGAFARDDTLDTWNQSAGAYWASRAAISAGQPELAPDFLRMAARHDRTFYGLLAQRQLGIEPPLPARAMLAQAQGELQTVADTQVDTADAAAFIRSDARAKRAAALAQIGLYVEAGFEVRDGLAASRTEEERRRWVLLALAVRAPIIPGVGAAGGVDEAAYPMPTLTPRGGFTLDRALVYAIVRQESRFNPSVRSHAGATGLMQLMPNTAFQVTRDAGMRDPARLSDPATNLRIGQDYFHYLLRTRIVSDDLLLAVAAYNGGPGTVLRTQEQLAGDTDALMVIESLPYSETRAYVERVMANYWIYRRLMGQDTPTLDALASGSRQVRASLDAPQAVATAPAFTALAAATASTGGAAPGGN